MHDDVVVNLMSPASNLKADAHVLQLQTGDIAS